jgi:hypothetical protein
VRNREEFGVAQRPFQRTSTVQWKKRVLRVLLPTTWYKYCRLSTRMTFTATLLLLVQVKFGFVHAVRTSITY